jgi:hypothetical protein
LTIFYFMASYPSAVYAPRTKENKTGIVYDPTQKTIGYVEDVVKLDNEVVALETELGLLPKATSASVQERLKGIRSLSDAAADVLVVKGSNVGIGTTAPSGKLHLSGSTLVDSWMSDTAAALDTKNWVWQVGSAVGTGVMRLRALNDANTNGVNAIEFTRTGISTIVTSIMSGNVGIGTIPTAKLDINSDIMRLRTAKTPASAGAAGNAGDICWDANFIYICVATNSWTRVAIAAW